MTTGAKFSKGWRQSGWGAAVVFLLAVESPGAAEKATALPPTPPAPLISVEPVATLGSVPDPGRSSMLSESVRLPAGGVGKLRSDEETVRLGPLKVNARSDAPVHFDPTGMGSYEQQLRDPTFSNDLVSMDLDDEEPAALQVAEELRFIASPSPVDLATGDTRLSLSGFPTPLLRNGFVTMGALDMLNTSRLIVIQGALVPVLGRAAPGGIQDYWTARPRTQPGQRFDYSLSSLKRQSALTEIVGVTVPAKAWHRVAADWSRRVGPEEYAVSETRGASGSVTWRHSPAASTLFAVDYQQVHATAAPGIPEYRQTTTGKIIGPYRPLAGFNALGPEAGVRRRTAAATVLLDAQPHPKLAVRAGVEAWWRNVEQDRFTTSLYNVALGRFEGTREPRHIEQPQFATLGHFEGIARFSAWGAEHKFMVAVNHTVGRYDREERALSVELRNALPAGVRLFRPDAPDYSRPPFDRAAYSRVLTDRTEDARYTSIEVSERVGIKGGRIVFTTGVRQDFVGLQIDDRRPGAVMPNIEADVQQGTYHFGANYQVIPSRLLLFSTASSAFEPSSRIDVRTGRLQANEMTRGYEMGMKGRFFEQTVDLSATGFLLYNEDISRRNPLYDHPIFDANHTQPQLVASGKEEFSGGRLEGRWRPLPALSFSMRATYSRAITTSSPDIPEEVGRQMTRVPLYTASSSASYGFAEGILKGTSMSATWSYISGYTAYYEDRQRQRQDYPGYALVGVSVSRSQRIGRFTHGVGMSVRNLFDRDLLTSHARMGMGREFVGSYRLMF